MKTTLGRMAEGCCSLQLALGGGLLLFLGANLHDPYLLPVRGWALPAILAAAGLGLGFLLLGRRGKRLRRALLLLWIAAPLTSLAAEARFQHRKEEVLGSHGLKVQELGRHFVIGYTDLEEIKPLAAQGLIGGIFLTSHNIEGRTAEDLRREVAALQQLRQDAGLPPLIVATDQEGGIVSHLSPPLTALPALAELTALSPEQRLIAAKHSGAIHGRELAAIGITVNFAPVVDLRPDSPSGHWDFHSLIQRRAISEDPAVVTQLAQGYAQGLTEAGVRPTVKHFPGLGRVREDTHHFRAYLAASRAALEASDWVPFHQLLSHSEAWLMVGHVTVTAIDPDHPASHSRKLIDGIIRQDWGYQGVIITDDLTMGAVYQHGYCEAVIDALNAGADLLLISFDGEQYYRAMDCAEAGQRRGLLDSRMLERSAARLNADRALTD